MNGQSDIAVWILGGVVTALGTLLWWSLRLWIKSIGLRFDKIMDKLVIIEKQNVGFEKDIHYLSSQISSHDKRLHDHGERLRDLEQTIKK